MRAPTYLSAGCPASPSETFDLVDKPKGTIMTPRTRINFALFSLIAMLAIGVYLLTNTNLTVNVLQRASAATPEKPADKAAQAKAEQARDDIRLKLNESESLRLVDIQLTFTRAALAKQAAQQQFQQADQQQQQADQRFKQLLAETQKSRGCPDCQINPDERRLVRPPKAK